MKKVFLIFLSFTLAAGMCACGSSDVTDQVANVVQAEDSHVLTVKGGTPNAYPDKTYGDAFDSFFGSPAWKYFVGTKEGPDEDGDGQPDYTVDEVDIVEFTGYCTYQDVKVKALIQFTLSEEDNTFEATYLSYNDVPQSMLMLSALLETVFTNDDVDDIDKIVETGDTENSSSEEVEETTDDYAQLDEFINLICSFSDPPDLEGDELTEYFKQEYVAWKNGEGYMNIIMNAEGHLVIPDHTAEYVGTWYDTYSQRCNMEITSSDGIYYSININWGSSASENTHWSFYGMFDEMAGGIHYYGSEIEETYTEDKGMQETYVYSDGEGLLWIGDDGMLYWDDYIEKQGAECSFERLE